LETSLEYGRGLLRGIVRYARLHGPWSLALLPGHIDRRFPIEELSGFAGVIARISTPDMAKALKRTGLPVLALGSSTDAIAAVQARLGFNELKPDDRSIARLAAEHLIERGFRHFAYAGFPHCPWSQCRGRMFARMLLEKGFACDMLDAVAAGAGRLFEYRQAPLRKWVQSLPRPVGVFACNDIGGHALLEACQRADIRVPEEVAVIGVDNDEPLCETSDPPLSSVAIDLAVAGYEAAALLDRLMRNARCRHRRQIVWARPAHVVVRRSTDVLAQMDLRTALALRFIRDHAARNIGVPDVAGAVMLARRTLERRFTMYVGHSVHTEIIRARLERARRLLVETRLPLYRIAEEAGFGELRSMNRAFRRHGENELRDRGSQHA
jgi:LacI family transcriptional regulator